MGDAGGAVMRGAVPVSVILPTYNRGALLPRSIGSVIGQTYEKFELVVVDDGSEDDTAAVVSGFSDERIRYIKLPRNRGLSAARNAGIAEARGAYLAFQDSDDEWHGQKLARQLNALHAHPEAAVVYSDMHRRANDGRLMYLRSPTIVRGRLTNPETHFWQSYMLAMQPALVRRECVGDLWFDERLVMFEDLDFYLRLARRCDFFHMREPLVTYFETQGLTTNRSKEFTARRQLVRKYRGALLARDPAFLVRETVNTLLRRSLMPIVNRHLTPI